MKNGVILLMLLLMQALGASAQVTVHGVVEDSATHERLAKTYYQRFVEQAAAEEKPTQQLTEMVEKAKEMLRIYELREKYKARRK